MNLSQLVTPPKYSSMELSAAKNFLHRRDFFTGVVNFAIIGTNPLSSVVKEENFNQPCHRKISLTEQGPRSLVATECGWKRRPEGRGRGIEEDFKPFFDWLTKESFAAPFIVDASLSEAEGFVVSTDVFTPLFQNIMIVTRHFYEAELSGFVAFNKMVASGIDGRIAYPIAFNSSVSLKTGENSKFFSNFIHRMTHLFSLKAFENFVKGDLGTSWVASHDFNNAKYHYRNWKNYERGRDIFWDGLTEQFRYNCDYKLVEDVMSLEGFRDLLRESRKDGKVMYKAPNPFAPKAAGFVPPSQSDITNEEAVDILAPFLHGLFIGDING